MSCEQETKIIHTRMYYDVPPTEIQMYAEGKVLTLFQAQEAEYTILIHYNSECPSEILNFYFMLEQDVIRLIGQENKLDELNKDKCMLMNKIFTETETNSEEFIEPGGDLVHGLTFKNASDEIKNLFEGNDEPDRVICIQGSSFVQATTDMAFYDLISIWM